MQERFTIATFQTSQDGKLLIVVYLQRRSEHTLQAAGVVACLSCTNCLLVGWAFAAATELTKPAEHNKLAEHTKLPLHWNLKGKAWSRNQAAAPRQIDKGWRDKIKSSRLKKGAAPVVGLAAWWSSYYTETWKIKFREKHELQLETEKAICREIEQTTKQPETCWPTDELLLLWPWRWDQSKILWS